MQPPFDIAADLDTPVSAFLKLRPFRPRFLLESVEGGERFGRYSYIGFGEGPSLRLDQAGLHMLGETRPRPEKADALLAALRELTARAPQPGRGVPGLRYAGGPVGVSSYDLVRFFERLPDAPPAEGAGAPDALYVAPRSLLVFDHLTHRVALLHEGDADERAALRRDVMAALRGPTPTERAPGGFEAPTPSLGREDYMTGVERAKEAIREGEVYQLVLSARFAGESTLSPFQVYRALRCLNPSPYLYYFDFDDLQVVGSSPEALVSLSGRQAALRPIAGTRPRGENEERDLALERELLADPKEAAEHVMLVDLARNDLGRVAVPGSVRVEPYRSIERYSHVMHMVSGVVGVLEPKRDAFDLFAATFPAGTVVGAPKVRAMQLIDELEPVRRGIYAGTVGYFDATGSMDQAIAIRTLTFSEGRYAFQAGAGLVAESEPSREYDEVLAKSAAMRAALALAGEGL